MDGETILVILGAVGSLLGIGSFFWELRSSRKRDEDAKRRAKMFARALEEGRRDPARTNLFSYDQDGNPISSLTRAGTTIDLRWRVEARPKASPGDDAPSDQEERIIPPD